MPLSPSATRELLQELGHHPRRHLGQNFLVDGNIVRKSIALAGATRGEPVVEIGPGLGTLTEALLMAGAEVWAVERDPVLARHLRDTLVIRFPDRLHLLEGDALDHPRAGLPDPAAASGFQVVANLPYAISTPWMDAILSGPLPRQLVLMLQLEAADRFTAQPDTKLFGAISILLQSAYQAASGYRVSPTCFHPRPEVDSRLLHLVRLPEPFRFRPETRQLLRALFQQRRKQIGALLREQGVPGGEAWLELLAQHGLDRRTRPEDIPVSLWQRLPDAGREPDQKS